MGGTLSRKPPSLQATTSGLKGGNRQSQSSFARLVAGAFATRVSQLALALAVSFALALLLGPAGRGIYYTLTAVPATLGTLATLGLPASLTFFAARGANLPMLRRQVLALGLGTSGLLVAVAVLVMPTLAGTALRTVPLSLVPWALAALPFLFTGSLIGNVLYGRQQIKSYNIIAVGQTGATLILVLVLVAALHLGVLGAIASFVGATAGGAVLALIVLGRTIGRSRDESGPPVPTRALLGYGVRLYPGVVFGFFNLRADIYLLNWLLGSAAATGLYSLSVSLAELVFYVPDSVSAILLPRVASAERSVADRSVSDVARLTILLAALIAIALAPAAWLAIGLLLPDFIGSTEPLLVLLPAVVALSLSRVLIGYLTGIGMARPTVLASSAALAANLGANLLLIPTWGIVGAATSSLVSYSLSATLLLRSASRASGVPARDFVVPKRDDLRRIASLAKGIVSGLTNR